MRIIYVVAVLTPLSAMAAPAPHCALAPGEMTSASDHMSASIAAPLPATHAADIIIPKALSGIPFVQHVASAGATITDFGETHGVHQFAARNGEQFMLFEMSTDGQAAISGAVTELSPDQLEVLAKGNITQLGVSHGFTGFFVRSGPSFQVFYATPDMQRLIPGILWDAAGKDLTREQVSGIPGAVPTVVVEAPAAPSSPIPATTPLLPIIENAASGIVGNASAPHLWMMIDPQCVYSIRAFQMLQSYIVAGKVQVSIVPLAILDYEDQGQSTRSALALLSKPPEQVAAAWQTGSVNETPSPEARARLDMNMEIAHTVGVQGTPMFFWKKQDGSEGRLDGLPSDMTQLVASVGG